MINTDTIASFHKSEEITVDTEGTLNHPFSQTWGLSISNGTHSEYYPFNHKLGNNLPQSDLSPLKNLIEAHSCVIFHNAKHDLRALRNLDIHRKGKFYDTMIMTHMIDENLFSKELEVLTRMIGGQPKRNKEVMEAIIKAFGWEYIPVDIIAPYGRGDASDTWDIFEHIFPEFRAQGFDGELWGWEQELTRLLMDIEDRGILLDQNLCQQELEKGEKKLQSLQERLGFNPGSPKQLGNFLVNEMGLPVVKKTEKGSPSFNKAALEIYDELLTLVKDDRAKLIKEYRGWAKAVGSNYRPYLEHLGPDGRLRTQYKQHGTVTGRLSAAWKQQIPRQSSKEWNGQLKKVFTVEPGRTRWEVDYSQLEMRLNAAYSREQELIDIFNDPSRDLFNEMSAAMKMSRDDVKVINYLLSYGGGTDAIMNGFGIGEIAAKVIKNKYHRRWPLLHRFSLESAEIAEERGYVKYWTGRRRHFPVGANFHLAANSLIQGGGFEIVKRAMIRVKQEGLLASDECKMDIQVHDSGGYDIENGREHIYLPEIKRIWEDVSLGLGVDIKFPVDIHKWATKEKYSV